MIRHRPYGSGDPYRLDPDQRYPVVPEVGHPFTLNALASADIDGIAVQWRTDDSVRELTARRLGSVEPDGAWSGEGHLADAAHSTRRRGTVWTVRAPALRYGQIVHYRFVSTNGRRAATRWHQVQPARWTSTGGSVTLRGPLAARERFLNDSVEVFADTEQSYRLRFALALREGDHVLGFGERFDALDQRGRTPDSVVYEQYKDQGETGRTYLPMPFAHIINAAGPGGGFHVDTSRRCWFDVGASTPDRLVIEVDTTGQAGPAVELQLYEGLPHQVLKAFLADTGAPPVPPDWIYRLWISGNEWNTQQSVLQRADRHFDLDIPFGVVVIEAWSDESTFCFFRDARYEIHEDGSPHTAGDISYPAEGAWPDPKSMIDDLHARGVRVLLWQIPLQKMNPHPSGQAAADARTMIEQGYTVQQADGRPYRNRGWWFPQALMPDFTNPAARSWWQGKRRYLVDELSIDGFKTDGGEHAWGHDLRYHDGRRGVEGNNRFPVEYARTYHDLMVGAGVQPVTFSRAGYTGAPVYPCHWAGDENSTWPAFRNSIIAGLSAGSCGIVHWGWDLAGFSGEIPDAELYLRATQASCFMPIMQYHSEFNFHRLPSRDRTPWNIAERHNRPDVVEIFRTFAKLRESLLPYLSEQGRRSIASGYPLMRALPLVHPTDERAWDFPGQFLLGDDLLVAPVTEPGVREWTVYLPEGEWVNLFDGSRHEGGVGPHPAPLEWSPVFARGQSWLHLSALLAT